MKNGNIAKTSKFTKRMVATKKDRYPLVYCGLNKTEKRKDTNHTGMLRTITANGLVFI